MTNRSDYLIGGVDLDLSLIEGRTLAAEIPIDLASDLVAPTQIDTNTSLERVLQLTQKIEELQKYAGYDRWFQPGTPYGVDKLPKHKAFMDCSARYRQIYLSGANRCFAEGTLVATPSGPVPIESLKPGDSVYAADGSVTQVIALHNNGEATVYPLVNRNKVYAWCTENHELDVVTGRPGRSWTRRRVKASDLVKDDYVRRLNPHNPLGPVREPHAYVLGAFLGDGCCTCGSSNNQVMSSSNEAIPAKIASILGVGFKKLSGNNYSYNIGFKVEDVRHYKEWCHGKLAHQKIADISAIKTWDRQSVLEFVAGLIDTDGSLSKSKDGMTLSLSMQAGSVVEAFRYCALALWNEDFTLSVDNRDRYKNGPVLISGCRNPHKLVEILKELRPHLCNKYKAEIPDTTSYGKRSFKDRIKLNLDMRKPRMSVVYDITVAHEEHFYLLANGISVSNCGKTQTASWLTAHHLTGEYPDWYEGKRWTKPIQAWAAGDFNHTTRDIIQQSLLGNPGEFGTGMIPKEKIVNYTSKSGVSGGIDKLYIRHVSGGLSCLQFKAYKQSNESFYGTAMDWIWLDELPNEAIFSECFTRTMTTGGIVCVTATPLAGMTPLVYSFYSEADFLPNNFQLPNTIRMAKEDLERKNDEARQKGEQVVDGRGKKVVVCIGWDDAPWLSENEKIEQLASTPPHLRQAKSTGIPGDTGGMVFPIAMSELLVDDFPIPAHYKLINGLDPGWHNTGAIFCALDPDTDTLYVYADYKRGQAEIVVHAEAIKTKSKWADAPVIWDYAGMGGRAEEESTRNLYRKHGLKLINADKSVMAGIAAVWERMSTGKLKIFKSCRTLQQELATYQMDEKGNIVKENDHCVDPLKYVSLATKHARAPHQGIGSSFGVMKGQVGGKKYFG